MNGRTAEKRKLNIDFNIILQFLDIFWFLEIQTEAMNCIFKRIS